MDMDVVLLAILLATHCVSSVSQHDESDGSGRKGCAQPEPLGLEDGSVGNQQITASSYYSGQGGFEPWKGRLKYNGNWGTEEEDPVNPWIQVDFLNTVIITGILTQGNVHPTRKSYVTMLQIQTGDSVNALSYIMAGNDPSTFSTNINPDNRDEAMEILFPGSIIARYLRIRPLEWFNWCSLRFEVIGCQLIDECTEGTDDCDSNANCSDLTDGYHCRCRPGYTGNGIECTDIDECDRNPCFNGGSCADGINGYDCICPQGLTGDHCETDIDECASNPCYNGGSCVHDINEYECMCPDKWTGEHCETETSSAEQTNTTDTATALPSTSPQLGTNNANNGHRQTTTDTTALIVGGIIGGILLIMLALLLVYIVFRCRRQDKPKTNYVTISGVNNATASNNRDLAPYTDINDIDERTNEQSQEYTYAEVNRQSSPHNVSDNIYTDIPDDTRQSMSIPTSSSEGMLDNHLYVSSDGGTVMPPKSPAESNQEEGWVENDIYDI